MAPHEQMINTASANSQVIVGPHQRAYSVMAVPSELEYHYHRHSSPTHTRKHQSQQEGEESLIWYQEIYKKYGYEPNKSKNSSPSYFGPYLLLQTLGEGEFAKVKAGVHVQTNQEVAIKLMRKDHIKHASLETKLEREISVLKSVRHPYIVKLFEVLTIKNYIGIVLQRAAGGELFDYILKHHYLQETEAKRLFAQLISGVHYMHQKHIVHRDLKLENLLLSKDRDIIITDFGFANRFLIAQQDLMATSCGSPCYAAPELVINDDENNHYVGTAVDIWSCGVILFAMLCGYLPFDDDPSNPQGANINVLYKYIVSTKLEIPNHISQDAIHLLRIMLVPDPTKRCNMDDIRNHPWLKEHQEIMQIDYIAAEQQQSHMSVSDTRLFNSVKEKNQVLQTHDDNNTMLPATTSNAAATENENSVNTQTTTTIPDLRQEYQDNKVAPAAAAAAVVPCTTTTHDQNNNNMNEDDVPSLKEEQEEEEEEAIMSPNTPPIITSEVMTSKPATSTTTTNSFLQAKFFSTLQQQSNNNTQKQQRKERPSSVSPISNKIPNRSQSVQQHTTRRERSTSEYSFYTSNKEKSNNNKHMSLNILPSVSEQSTIVFDQQQITPSASQAIRAKGQKLMDWFKRKPSSSQSTKFTPSTITNGMYNNNRVSQPPAPKATKTTARPERPISALPPPSTVMRAMSIGKPLGSYAADFNDAKLRLHRGAVDQDALTSKAPNEVLLSIKESLQLMGIDMKRVSDFKIKCVRPAKHQLPVTRTRKMSTVPFKLFFSTSTTTATTAATHKRMSTSQGQQQKQQASPPATPTPSATPTIVGQQQTIYGEQGIDNGEEVQFTVELSKIENLPGLYVVDIKRTRGNIWAFKFLYHTLLDLLDLSDGNMGYMAQRRVKEEEDTISHSSKNRISYLTTSSSGSSMMIFDESHLHK